MCNYLILNFYSVCVFVCVAHQGAVTVVLFVLEMEWVLSTGQDKSFTWYCSESGHQLGTYRTAAWVTGLQYPYTPTHTHTQSQELGFQC